MFDIESGVCGKRLGEPLSISRSSSTAMFSSLDYMLTMAS